MGLRSNSHRTELRAVAAAAVSIGVLVADPSAVSASNGATPRTPPVFQRPECLSVVDRTVDPQFVVEFSIPIEDAQLTPDELADSRSFQFFALCADAHPRVVTLPNWITTDDAQRAFDAGLIPTMPTPQDVIQTHPTWANCALAINGTDERIPITCDATEGGVVWDTTSVPAGNYVIRGYNFEPSLNLWVPRRGVVQVGDGEARPVVSLVSPPVLDNKAFEEAGTVIEGCMAGPAATTVTLSWARLVDLGEDQPSDWTAFAELDAADGQFSVLFEPPPTAVNQAVVFRGEAVGPAGERWIGYAPGSVTIYPGDGESDGPQPPGGLDHCGFFPEPDPPQDPTTGGSTGDMGSTGGETDATVTGQDDSGSSPTAAADPPPADDGCGCRVPRGGEDGKPQIPTWLCVLAFAAPFRRRPRVAV